MFKVRGKIGKPVLGLGCRNVIHVLYLVHEQDTYKQILIVHGDKYSK